MNLYLQLTPSQKKWLNLIFVALAVIMGLAAAVAAWIIRDPRIIVLGLIGIAAILLTFYRVEYGLLVLIFITFARVSDVLIKYHGAPSIAKVFIPVLVVVVLARWLLFRIEPSPWLTTAVVLGIYGMVGVASLLYAHSPADVLNALDNYVKDAIIAIAIVMIIRDGITLRRAVWALLFAALFLSALTTYQQLTGTFANNYWGFAQAETQQIVTGTSDFRLSGPISANYYALILIMIVPLALDRLWHEESRLLRLLAAIVLFTSIFSIIFTYSRGGFLALIVVAGLMLWHHRTSLMPILGLLVLVLIAYQVVPAQYKARLALLTDLVTVVSSDETAVVTDSSLRGRQSEVTAAWQMFGDHPFIGVGLGNFNINYLDYAEHLGLDTRGQARSAHSLYLEVASETGLVGILAFGLILTVAFGQLYLAYPIFLENKQPDYANITWALSVGLIGHLTGSLFLHLAYPRYFWLMIGLVIATKNVADYERNRLKTIEATKEQNLYN